MFIIERLLKGTLDGRPSDRNPEYALNSTFNWAKALAMLCSSSISKESARQFYDEKVRNSSPRDGNFSHRATHPSFGLEKRYLVEIEGNFDKRHLDQLLEGVNLEDGFARALKAELVRSVSKNHHWVDIVIHEGRYHIIRRLLESSELKVLRLIRTEFGPVKLSEMKSGRHRPLNNQELVKLFTTLNIKQ